MSRKGFVLLRHEDVFNTLKDPRFVSSRSTARGEKPPFIFRFMPGIIRMLQDSMVLQDGESHRRLRTLVHKAFTPRTVEEMASAVTRMTNELLDRAEAKGGTIDLMEDFALPLPLNVISELMGVPEHERLRFSELSSAAFDESAQSLMAFVAQMPAVMRLTRFLRELVAYKQREPGPDLTSALIAAHEGSDAFTDDELVAMLFLLMLAGHETTVNLIGSGMLALLENPEQLALLRAEPERMDAAIEELARYTSPVSIPAARYGKETFEIHGQVIERGSPIVALIASANRDARIFTDPHRLDITRTPNRHLGFGHGVHFCLGIQLARLEARAAFSTLLLRFPKLRLAVPASEVKRRPSVALPGLRELPLHLV